MHISSRIPRGTSLFGILFCCLLLTGCASKLVQTVSISEEDQEDVRARFGEFSRQQCLQTLDADITLEMSLLGRTKRAGGTLQAQAPSSLRYTTLGPMDRALYIMVTDGSTFTLVNNRKARAYTGPVDSRYWHEYFPENIQVSDLFPLLTGRLAGRELLVHDIQGDTVDPAVAWLFLGPVNGRNSVIRFDSSKGVILRHMIQDDGGDVLLDVVYNRYNMQFPRCPLPLQMQVEGETITGSISISYERVFPDAAFTPATFKLTVPKHYTVKKVK